MVICRVVEAHVCTVVVPNANIQIHSLRRNYMSVVGHRLCCTWNSSYSSFPSECVCERQRRKGRASNKLQMICILLASSKRVTHPCLGDRGCERTNQSSSENYSPAFGYFRVEDVPACVDHNTSSYHFVASVADTMAPDDPCDGLDREGWLYALLIVVCRPSQKPIADYGLLPG